MILLHLNQENLKSHPKIHNRLTQSLPPKNHLCLQLRQISLAPLQNILYDVCYICDLKPLCTQ